MNTSGSERRKALPHLVVSLWGEASVRSGQLEDTDEWQPSSMFPNGYPVLFLPFRTVLRHTSLFRLQIRSASQAGEIFPTPGARRALRGKIKILLGEE
jgi:hypothetical protein